MLSRTADHLFWMSRYIERAESLARLLDVTWQMSGEVVLMTLLGGMGTVFGPVVGAFTIISLEHFLADRGQWVTVITGTIFVVCVLAFRRGIVGELAAWWAKRRG